MADLPLELYHEKRKKRKRAAAEFFITVVAVAQHMYCRRKILLLYEPLGEGLIEMVL
jgi:hypothetical protein